jgi:hypothetical protein
MPKNKTDLKPQILERLARGEELAEICEALAISVRTVQDWRNKDQDFALLYSSVADRQAEAKASFLLVLEKSLGIVQTACKKAQISRTTFYTWKKSDPDFAAAVEEVQNVALDFAEEALFKAIQEGNISGIIFYLKTKGKDRGYVERQEVVGSQVKPLEVSLTLSAKDLSSDDPDPEEEGSDND